MLKQKFTLTEKKTDRLLTYEISYINSTIDSSNTDIMYEFTLFLKYLYKVLLKMFAQFFSLITGMFLFSFQV